MQPKIKLDSVRAEFPIDCVNTVNKEYFVHKPTNTLQGENISDKYELKFGKVSGLGSFILNMKAQTGNIYFSAKTLEKDYSKGININTVEQAIENINSSGFLSLKKNEFIENAIIYNCDVTQNLKVSSELNKYLQCLAIMKRNRKYKIDSGNLGSIIFTKDVTTKNHRERMIFYDKLRELNSAQSKHFYQKYIQSFNADFNNVLRVEQNLRSHKKIRESLGVKDRSLIKILKSEKNPNYELFKKIREPENSLFEKYKNESDIKLIIVNEGIENIIVKLDYDLKRIREFVKEKTLLKNSRQTYYNYLKLFEEKYYQLLKENESGIVDVSSAILKEIEELIKTV